MSPCFGHALIQDAAYQPLLKATRQEIHARIAAVLEGRFPRVATGEPEVLAQHYAGAGLVEQAIDYWGKAGDRAVQRSANTEAIRHIGKGLELVETLTPGGDRHVAAEACYRRAWVIAQGQGSLSLVFAR